MEFILKKFCITCGTIKKILKYFDKNILLLLYNSLIISHIRYGIGTWYNGNKTTVQKIQKIVNKFIITYLNIFACHFMEATYGVIIVNITSVDYVLLRMILIEFCTTYLDVLVLVNHQVQSNIDTFDALIRKYIFSFTNRCINSQNIFIMS